VLAQPRTPKRTTEQEKKLLLQAAKSGDVDKVQEILVNNPSVPQQAISTAFLTSAEFGYTQVVQFLGSRVNYSFLDPALIRAAKRGNKDVASYLLEMGASIEARGAKSDVSPLLSAVLNKKQDMMRFLLKKKADVSSTDSSSNTILHIAAQTGFAVAVGIALNAGAKCNVLNASGHSPLECSKNEGIARIILEWFEGSQNKTEFTNRKLGERSKLFQDDTDSEFESASEHFLLGSCDHCDGHQSPFERLPPGAPADLFWNALKDPLEPPPKKKKKRDKDLCIRADYDCLALTKFGIYPFDRLERSERIALILDVAEALGGYKPIEKTNILLESSLYAVFELIKRRICDEILVQKEQLGNSEDSSHIAVTLWRKRALDAFMQAYQTTTDIGLRETTTKLEVWYPLVDLIAAATTFGSSTFWAKRASFRCSHAIERRRYLSKFNLGNGYFQPPLPSGDSVTPEGIELALRKLKVICQSLVIDSNSGGECLCADCLAKSGNTLHVTNSLLYPLSFKLQMLEDDCATQKKRKTTNKKQQLDEEVHSFYSRWGKEIQELELRAATELSNFWSCIPSHEKQDLAEITSKVLEDIMTLSPHWETLRSAHESYKKTQWDTDVLEIEDGVIHLVEDMYDSQVMEELLGMVLSGASWPRKNPNNKGKMQTFYHVNIDRLREAVGLGEAWETQPPLGSKPSTLSEPFLDGSLPGSAVKPTNHWEQYARRMLEKLVLCEFARKVAQAYLRRREESRAQAAALELELELDKEEEDEKKERQKKKRKNRRRKRKARKRKEEEREDKSEEDEEKARVEEPVEESPGPPKSEISVETMAKSEKSEATTSTTLAASGSEIAKDEKDRVEPFLLSNTKKTQITQFAAAFFEEKEIPFTKVISEGKKPVTQARRSRPLQKLHQHNMKRKAPPPTSPMLPSAKRMPSPPRHVAKVTTTRPVSVHTNRLIPAPTTALRRGMSNTATQIISTKRMNKPAWQTPTTKKLSTSMGASLSKPANPVRPPISNPLRSSSRGAPLVRHSLPPRPVSSPQAKAQSVPTIIQSNQINVSMYGSPESSLIQAPSIQPVWNVQKTSTGKGSRSTNSLTPSPRNKATLSHRNAVIPPPPTITKQSHPSLPPPNTNAPPSVKPVLKNVDPWAWMERFTDGGMMFICSNETYKECLKMKLFGLPRQYLKTVKSLHKNTSALFLFNMVERELYGVYEPTGKGGENIKPNAWVRKKIPNSRDRESPFPAQIPFKIIREFKPLPESAFRHMFQDGNRIRKLSAQETKQILYLFKRETLQKNSSSHRIKIAGIGAVLLNTRVRPSAGSINPWGWKRTKTAPPTKLNITEALKGNVWQMRSNEKKKVKTSAELGSSSERRSSEGKTIQSSTQSSTPLMKQVLTKKVSPCPPPTIQQHRHSVKTTTQQQSSQSKSVSPPSPVIIPPLAPPGTVGPVSLVNWDGYNPTDHPSSIGKVESGKVTGDKLLLKDVNRRAKSLRMAKREAPKPHERTGIGLAANRRIPSSSIKTMMETSKRTHIPGRDITTAHRTTMERSKVCLSPKPKQFRESSTSDGWRDTWSSYTGDSQPTWTSKLFNPAHISSTKVTHTTSPPRQNRTHTPTPSLSSIPVSTGLRKGSVRARPGGGMTCDTKKHLQHLVPDVALFGRWTPNAMMLPKTTPWGFLGAPSSILQQTSYNG